MSVHEEHAVAFGIGSLDESVLFFFVGGIEVDQHVVLVFLVAFNQRLVLVESEVLPVNVFEECEILGTVVERFLSEHTIVDEEFQVVPFLFVFFSVLVKDSLQAVGHFLGDVGRDFLHVGVALQVAS